jgi:hypothetical protein
MRRIGIAVVGTVSAIVLLVSGTASARVIEMDTFHDVFSDRVTRFCDVGGFTADLDFTVDGRFMLKSRGPDQLVYYQEHVKVTQVITNVATGESVTEVDTVMTKDQRVTNNGDGTLTLLVLATGNAVVYGPNGKAIARNPGQIRFKLLLDHGGTPRDPSDDEFLEFLGIVKDSTGRTDDFCAAIVQAIG